MVGVGEVVREERDLFMVQVGRLGGGGGGGGQRHAAQTLWLVGLQCRQGLSQCTSLIAFLVPRELFLIINLDHGMHMD